jgi:hypothetical protein
LILHILYNLLGSPLKVISTCKTSAYDQSTCMSDGVNM